MTPRGEAPLREGSQETSSGGEPRLTPFCAESDCAPSGKEGCVVPWRSGVEKHREKAGDDDRGVHGGGPSGSTGPCILDSGFLSGPAPSPSTCPAGARAPHGPRSKIRLAGASFGTILISWGYTS